VVIVSAEERIADEIGVQGGLELVGQVPDGDPGPDFPVLLGDPEIGGPALLPASFRDIDDSRPLNSASL
jgi:hypothetical protein